MSKGPDAFRTISEASDEIGVPQHVLRFWETKFTFLKPMKRAGGRRLYRPQDIEMLRGVKRLLHDDGMTIRGVQKLYRDGGLARISGGSTDTERSGAVAPPPVEPIVTLTIPPASRPARDLSELRAALASVEAAKRRLDAALNL